MMSIIMKTLRFFILVVVLGIVVSSPAFAQDEDEEPKTEVATDAAQQPKKEEEEAKSGIYNEILSIQKMSKEATANATFFNKKCSQTASAVEIKAVEKWNNLYPGSRLVCMDKKISGLLVSPNGFQITFQKGLVIRQMMIASNGLDYQRSYEQSMVRTRVTDGKNYISYSINQELPEGMDVNSPDFDLAEFEFIQNLQFIDVSLTGIPATPFLGQMLKGFFIIHCKINHVFQNIRCHFIICIIVSPDCQLD